MLSPKSTRVAGAFLALVSVATLGVIANAQLGGTGGVRVPYQGALYHGGNPVDGTADFAFDIYNSPTGGGLCQSVEVPQTQVAAGQFSVVLSLSESCVRGRDLYVEIAVDGVQLPGRQRIHNAVAASTSGTGDFHVEGELLVTGEVGASSVDAPLISAGDFFTDSVRSEGPVVVQTGNTDTGPIESGLSFLVTGSMGAGSSADDGGFEVRHDNQTQGVGVGYNSIYATGTNADQDLNLRSRGNGRLRLNPTGQVTTVSAQQNNDGSISTYERSLQRLFIVAPFVNRRYRSYVPLSESLMLEYCGDQDGCTITVRMRNFGGNAGDQTAASRGPFHFDYGDLVNGNQRAWRTARADSSGRDGDGIVAHILNEWDCYFTDGQYFGGNTSTNDNGRGLGLLNTGDTYAATCELIIDD